MEFKPLCKKCGGELVMGEMMALPDGNGFVHKSCFSHENKKLPEALQKHFSEHDPTTGEAIERIDVSNRFFSDKEYLCNRCGFKFIRAAESYVRVCPNCGKDEFDQTFVKHGEIFR